MSQTTAAPIRQAMAAADAHDQQVQKIKSRPTERVSAYVRSADKMLDDAREELISMEAEHTLIVENLADEGQRRINGKIKEIEVLEAELADRKAQLKELETEGKEAIEKAVAEYERQKLAQQGIITAHQALRDALNPAYNPLIAVTKA